MRLPGLLSAAAKIVAVMGILAIGPMAARSQYVSKQTLSSNSEESTDDRLRNLQKQMLELKSVLEEMRSEMIHYQKETLELRQELEAARGKFAGTATDAKSASNTLRQEVLPAAESQAPANQESREAIRGVQEDQQLTNAKLDDLYQTKVASASKYRVRLSGMALLNIFSNKGRVDTLDFPSLARADNPFDSVGSFGATFRQSMLGFEVFGPQVKEAKVSADVQLDFAGGFPYAADGVTFGLARLRTGVIRMAWPSTTVVAGQDAPFFSPLSPTSMASIAVPAFSYAGNLWNWTPQVRVEHRFNITESSSFLLEGGILDPLTGEPPASQFLRAPLAGEASRQPAYASRVAWSHRAFGRDLTLGVGGYYSRQDWGFHRMVDGWAGTSDLIVPLTSRWELSGEFYRGRALGGVGGAIGRSVLFSGPITDPTTQVRGLNAAGGWAQLKFRQTEKLEWNGAFGEDNAFAADLRFFPLPQQSYFDPTLARNRSSFLNFIYRPRSDLFLSAEYRWLQTLSVLGSSETAGHINLSMGVLF